MKIKKAGIIFAGLLLLIISIFFSQKSRIETDECANEFTSNYYLDYRSQLTEFCNGHRLYETIMQTPALKELISAINAPFEDPAKARNYHENFVSELRKAIDANPSENESDFLNDFVNRIYTQADLKQSTVRYFYEHIKPKIDLNSSYNKILISLRENPHFSGLKHHEKTAEDQYFHGNLPFLLFTLPNLSGTKIIRLGYPLDSINRYRIPWINPQPHPEFRNFIENGNSHLYVNLMRRTGNESGGTMALESLEKTYPQFYVVSLDKNSDFYRQKKESRAMDAEQFKGQYLEQLLEPSGNYYWSSSLNLEDWSHELRKILNETQETFFANKDVLDKDERLDFIELSYLAILDKLTEFLQPYSLNITCRQCMDRGPSLYVLWMLKHHQVDEGEAKALLFAPPLLIHNRASHPAKIERFISAATRLNSNM